MKFKLSKLLTVAITVTASSALIVQLCLAADYSGKVGYFVKNAETYTRQGNHPMAAMMYDQAVRMQPGDMQLYYQRAASYGRAGYYQNAIKDLSLVINNDEMSAKRRFPSARKFRAECYAMSGQLQKAVDDYKEMLQINPNSGKLWYYLAETYAVMQRSDLAISAISKGLATKSHWADKLKNLHTRIMIGEQIKLHAPFSN